MNVIAINGSPRPNGNIATALGWMVEELERESISVETAQLGDKAIRGCTACGRCNTQEGKPCALPDDGINSLILALQKADGVIFGSPTYFGGMAGTLKSAMDRIFYAGRASGAYQNKVGAAAVSVRRWGGVETYNQIVTYYRASGIVIAPSQAWVIGYGNSKGEIAQDSEGQQAHRLQAKGMAWLLKMMDATKNNIAPPCAEKRHRMNFIR